MAGGMRRLMEYLGLVDPPYEEGYDIEPAPQQPAAPVRAPRATPPDEGVGAIRTIPRDAPVSPDPTSGVTLAPRPVQRIQPLRDPKVRVVVARTFADGQEIADAVKAGQPVIASVAESEPAVGRRIVDFCSAIVYMVDGRIQKVGKGLFLLTPPNVEISDAEKRRLAERGLYKLDI